MDLNVVRVVILVLALAAFLGIVAWAWSGRRKEEFEQAARLPFEDGERT